MRIKFAVGIFAVGVMFSACEVKVDAPQAPPAPPEVLIPVEQAEDVTPEPVTPKPKSSIDTKEVEVWSDGSARFGEASYKLALLQTKLEAWATKAQVGDDGFPQVAVQIKAAPDIDFEYVQKVIECCMKSQIWRISLGEENINLPREDGLLSARKYCTTVKVYWANSAGEVIHSPSMAFPKELSGQPLPKGDLAGAHLRVKIENKFQQGEIDKSTRCVTLENVTSEPCGSEVIESISDLYKLPSILQRERDNARSKNADFEVILDTRRTVPYKHFLEVLKHYNGVQVGDTIIIAPATGIPTLEYIWVWM